MSQPSCLFLITLGRLFVSYFALNVCAEAIHLPSERENNINARQMVGSLPPLPNGINAGHGPVVVSSTSAALATITPSPSASPVQVTQQSQLITSYAPQFTLCALPPIAFVPVLPGKNTTTSYSASWPPGNGTCSTFYSPTTTIVCATTLTGLATTYPVTDCAQQITFSSKLGYNIVTSTPTATNATNSTAHGSSNASLITTPPSIQTVTTYYLAPWQDLTKAGVPPKDVDVKICTSLANVDEQKCLLEHETWVTQLATITTKTTTSINLTTAIPGPSQLIIQTLVANITEAKTTLSLETNMVMQLEVITETLSQSRLKTPSVSTDFSTITVIPASNGLALPA
ncbi:MAG: hypothetical protein M1820_006670 [Bogoriella megaspora]|nr:MAG: hypothetical protein M1820_006670 [Bogoriella megaspora]